MPNWVWILIGAVVLIGAVAYFMGSGHKLPSGSTASAPAAVNESGTTYGNLT